jgi:orotidine-5'-phosphate decarboxylase
MSARDPLAALQKLAALKAQRALADLAAQLRKAAQEAQGIASQVFASPQEAAAIRALPQANGRLIVTPGVRPAGSASGDQKRTATPAQAIRDGADHIVVGRPVWQAADPREAARAITASLP